MNLKQRIEQDLKQSMLSGDKDKTLALKNIKSAILYAEVDQGLKETGLSDEEVTTLLGKELKKRQESAQMYEKGGAEDKRQAELAEVKIIETYLPQQMSDEQVSELVDKAMSSLGDVSIQNMGQIIGMVKKTAGASAEGSVIARIVKSRMDQK